MKYIHHKIKQQHGIIEEFYEILYRISQISMISKIVPGRIHRQQKWSSALGMTYSYSQLSGLKYIMKKWSTAQEVFVICRTADQEIVQQKIGDYLQTLR